MRNLIRKLLFLRPAAGVTLQLRAGIYQCVLLADGVVVARERLLITK